MRKHSNLSNHIDSPPTAYFIKLEKNDFIGVDDFDWVFNPCLVELVNHLKTNIVWFACLEEIKFQRQVKVLIYSKYLIHWRGRVQYLKVNSWPNYFCWWGRMMRNSNDTWTLDVRSINCVFYYFIFSSLFSFRLNRNL